MCLSKKFPAHFIFRDNNWAVVSISFCKWKYESFSHSFVFMIHPLWELLFFVLLKFEF